MPCPQSCCAVVDIIMSCSPPQARATSRASPKLPAGAMAPKACPKGNARSKSHQPGPPQPTPETRHWTEAQADRLDAACEVFGGHASVSAREAVQHLYRDTIREAVDFAQQAVQQQGGLGKGAGKLGKNAARRAPSRRRGSPNSQPVPGRPGASADPPFLPTYRPKVGQPDAEPARGGHADEIPSVPAQRDGPRPPSSGPSPVQCHLVMSLQPCAKNLITFLCFWNSVLGAR